MVTTRVNTRQAKNESSPLASTTSKVRSTPSKSHDLREDRSVAFNGSSSTPLQQLRIEEIDTDKLEQSFLDEYNPYLRDIAIRLLRQLTSNRLVNHDTWSNLLWKEYIKRDPEALPLSWQQSTHVLNNDDDDQTIINSASVGNDQIERNEHANEELAPAWNFFTLSLQEKILAVHYLCEWQLDEPERFRERLKHDENAEEWRVLPIGYDAKYKTYWLFDDNRLYCQHPLPRPKKASVKAAAQKKKKTVTSTVTMTTEEEPVWELAEEKQREMELAVLNRKRSSRIVMKELERAQLEEERNRRRIMEEKRQLEEQRKRKERKELKERWELREQRALEKERQPPVEPISTQEDESLYSELRTSSRHRETRKRKREADIVDFDCICGQHGQHYDEEQPTVFCQRCGVVQHLQCVEEEYPADAPLPDWTQYHCLHCQKILDEREREQERIREKARRREEKRKQMQSQYYYYSNGYQHHQDTDGDVDIEDSSDMESNISIQGGRPSVITPIATVNGDETSADTTTLSSQIRRINLRVSDNAPTLAAPLSLLPPNSNSNISPSTLSSSSSSLPISSISRPATDTHLNANETENTLISHSPFPSTLLSAVTTAIPATNILENGSHSSTFQLAPSITPMVPVTPSALPLPATTPNLGPLPIRAPSSLMPPIATTTEAALPSSSTTNITPTPITTATATASSSMVTTEAETSKTREIPRLSQPSSTLP
ncbi:hypothetical protein BDF19DRAFT_425860 [Syncephalis fuscata]|nr:hypothetical protein BDF19DRAFT_425860 [Syncephalis fuscata]